MSGNLKFATVENLNSRSKSNIMAALKNTINIYERRRFKIQTILVDPEFAMLEREEEISSKHIVNVASAGEHVPEIERFIRTLKERCRAQWSRLPYKECMPKIIIIALVRNCVTWLNSFPSVGSASSIYSPRTVMTGVKMDYNKHCQIPFEICTGI